MASTVRPCMRGMRGAACWSTAWHRQSRLACQAVIEVVLSPAESAQGEWQYTEMKDELQEEVNSYQKDEVQVITPKNLG